MEPEATHCYCKVKEIDEETPKLTCMKCRRQFHIDCLKTGKPSLLAGDVFFHLVCTECNNNGEEEVDRLKMQWSQVVLLALYNLQLSGCVGKYGYFRWKEHICAYIDKHWTVLFGGQRKKTSLWHGTVAGTLSSGCPQVFTSGAKELGENGWWRLTEMKPPYTSHVSIQTARQNRKRLSVSPVDSLSKVEGLRNRRGKTSIEAAMELKAKRETLTEAKDIRRAKSFTSLNTSSSDKQIFESLSQPSPSPVQSSSQDNLVTTFMQYIKQEPVDPSFSWSHNTNTSLSRSTLSSVDSFSPVNSSFCSVKSEVDDDSQFSHASSSKTDSWLTENELKPELNIPSLLMSADNTDVNDSDSDLEIDPGTITPPPGSPRQCDSPMLHDILSTVCDNAVDTEMLFQATEGKVEIQQEIQDIDMCVVHDSDSNQGKGLPMETNEEVKSVKEEYNDSVVDSESESENSSADENESTVHSDRGKSTGKTKIEKENKTENKENIQEEKCTLMSLYEERQLLKKLNDASNTCQLPPEINRLRRKLIIRQLKRERGQPIFDIDMEMNKMARKCWGDSWIQEDVNRLNPHGLPTNRFLPGDIRILDRFQTVAFSSKLLTQHKPSFLNRLVGTEDDQLQSIISPYTARILKPFIRRDYETKAKKMLLLEEIKAYPHRNDPSWIPGKLPPIDYCYVRPQHIPSVNTLCREFFWPGVDLSECLQYPDFSIIALFRKIVIGFAFMVPDVSYNEAYISFIFTHPEWRGAGIAKFMLYHLIQTCMGKDVRLHVSATNSAMLLYQKFGFKPEEFILDFYDKYYPEDSKECRHSFHLRLRR
ncbi:Hypothetical predicted protein [Mytilus galloprovincialis]|uniref:N-acetyltransferase domain-containing protein n=1 Tax=Mytilus galloprovincialis TaxID=29158 RepID=A0A8B6BMP4_MYTGA|nr:Hypothetical predicted protein [Mytilus galloprovincialis]VDH93069.1 Hypothetical predicted protein [Mytilus galloprovincialis]